MRDDGEAAGKAVDEALEPVEPVEVEVVRRLVEEEHVEAREQDRRQPGAGGLAAGERRRLPLERDRKPELGADRAGPRLEVRPAEREEALERGRVGVRLPLGRVPGDVRLGGGDAGAAGEVGEQRLARTAVGLLRQVADGQRRGRPLDAALVRLVEPGEQPEQGRLAGPVGADETQPRAGAERQVDAVENGAGAERADDAVERDTQGSLRRTQGRGRGASGAEQERLVSS